MYRKRGASGFTYATLVGLVAVVALISVTSLGSTVRELLGGVSDDMNGAVSALPDGNGQGDDGDGDEDGDSACSDETVSFTDSSTQVTVPPGCTEATVVMWGGGAGGGYYDTWGSGAGGFASGVISVTPGETLVVKVGGGGGASGCDSYECGGGGGANGGGFGTSGDAPGGGGGGLSGIFSGSYTQANALLIAGGGGAGTGYYQGGGGGGSTGGSCRTGSHSNSGCGGGGGQTAGSCADGVNGGACGSALTGGNGDSNGAQCGGSNEDGGGGGGGYWGGQGGRSDANGGGGGSGYYNPSRVTGAVLTTANNGGNGGSTLPPNTADTHYDSGIAVGGRSGSSPSQCPEAGGDGKVVITWGSGAGDDDDDGGDEGGDDDTPPDGLSNVYAWGGSYGSTPQRLEGAAQFTKIAVSGYGGACGLATNSKVWCWNDTEAPAPLSGNASYIDIAAGGALGGGGDLQFCGIGADHNAYCWAMGGAPVLQNAGGASFSKIAMTAWAACALTTGGGEYCWGASWYGVFGDDGATGDSTDPQPVDTGHSFVNLVTGYNQMCGIESDGKAYCSGMSWGGPTDSSTPEPMLGGRSFTQFVAGQENVCGLDSSHVVYCDGRLDSTDLDPNQRIPGFTFYNIASAERFACGVILNGRAYCWGGNPYGNTTTPQAVPGPGGEPLAFSKLFASGMGGNVMYGILGLGGPGGDQPALLGLDASVNQTAIPGDCADVSFVNIGGSPVTGFSAPVVGGEYSSSGCPATSCSGSLAPSASCAVHVRANSGTNQLLAGSVSLSASSGGSATAQVSGYARVRDPVFLAVAHSPYSIFLSDTGTEWIPAGGSGPPVSYEFFGGGDDVGKALGFANGSFYLIGDDGSNNVATSTRGDSWNMIFDQETELPDGDTVYSYEIKGYAYGNGADVVLGCGYLVADDTRQNIISRSTNGGASWAAPVFSPVPSGIPCWGDIAFGGGKFVVSDYQGSRTSGDGITWSGHAANSLFNNRMAYTGGRFVAMKNGNSSMATATDPDGTWTNATWTGGGINFLAASGGHFVAVTSGSPYKIYDSTNGTTWTQVRSGGTTTHPFLLRGAYGANVIANGGYEVSLTSDSSLSSWTEHQIEGGLWWNIVGKE
jgi:hypothetical protein